MGVRLTEGLRHLHCLVQEGQPSLGQVPYQGRRALLHQDVRQLDPHTSGSTCVRRR
ncbi:hypothetical protein ABZ946_33195 [Streptomyces sp. NPDC046324]|uniref:hypothetical protein n=1 Tax=Streptomyces sp. NPDC046324 TaxID=3154915 RepID=UPI0033EF6EE9